MPPSSVAKFIERFRDLHEKAKEGSLSPIEKVEYQATRAELGQMMLIAQHVSHSGKTLRSTLRIAQVLKVRIDRGADMVDKTTTIDIASGGFAALMPNAMPVGRSITFELQLPSSSATAMVKGTARVASTKPQGGLVRVSFTFDQVDAKGREALDMAILDLLIARFDAGTPKKK